MIEHRSFFFYMLRSVRVIDFRCFESLIIDFDSPTVFLTGRNAQGKTSILEAIAVASRLGSPKATVQSQFVREGCNGAGLALATDQHLFKVIYQERKFSTTIDGYPSKRAQYLLQTPRVIWMENKDLDLIRSSGEKRRRYMNAIGVQHSVDYNTSLKAYNKALQSRNALLRSNRSQDKTFQIFTELLVTHGQYITDYRQRIIERLKPFVQQAHQHISQGFEIFDMSYHPSSTNLHQDLLANLSKDIQIGQTSLGPHRDDIKFAINNRDVSTFGSEGQQRTLAISLKLGQGAFLKYLLPETSIFYLIDDVFGELDTSRKSALMEFLPQDAQKILTTTSLDWCDTSHQVFEIAKGAASLISN